MDGLIYVYALPRDNNNNNDHNARRPLLPRTAATSDSSSRPRQPHLSSSSSDSAALLIRRASSQKQKDNVSGNAAEIKLSTEIMAASGHNHHHHRAKTSVSSSSSEAHSDSHQSVLSNPYELRYGRRYLRDMIYPLPCDLAEIQRQNLRTLLGVTVFGGKASCAPLVSPSSLSSSSSSSSRKMRVPKRVLEVGCGSAYWSSTCHDYFANLGYPNVSFTGIDVAPVAPDLRVQGVDWTFVQHDLRRMPWPFEDEQFDLVMLKDLSLVMPLGTASQRLLDESIRVLRGGGTLEIWESDDILRCLLPHPPSAAGKTPDEEETAIVTQTYPITPGMPFTPAQNKYIKDSNAWIEEALDQRRLPANPCTRITQMLYQEPDSLCNVGFRRIAIPLSELKWEKERGVSSRKSSRAGLSGKAHMSKSRAPTTSTSLTRDQAALRDMALLTVLQKIESLEPVLKEVSGKKSEEWARWWGSMMFNLFEQEGSAGGECLEIGAWWATKVVH